MNQGFTRTSLALLAGIAVQVCATSAFACGGGGVTSSSGVVMNAQRILMAARANGTTEVVVQISVPETNAGYAVLIPVPSEPTLDATPVSSTDLDALDELTAPEIIVESAGGGSSGIGCGSAKSGGDTAEPSKGVVVSDPVEIGPVTALSLTGDDPGAVTTWLEDNGFTLPASDGELLANYVGQGHYFIAIKRNQSSANGEPSSIGVHYTLVGDHRQLSLAFARMGAAREVSFTLFLGAAHATAPSEPFAALTLDDLGSDKLNVGLYADAVREAVAAHASQAFVLESVTDLPAVTAAAPSLAAFLDADSVVTRATTLLPREALTRDAFFTRAFEREVPSRRFVALERERSYGTEFAFAAGVFLTMGLRRRTRR